MIDGKLGGVIVPVVTPTTPSGDVDVDGLRRQVERCTLAGVGAVFAGGSAGSGPLLPDEQWEVMARTVYEASQGKTKALIGIIATSTRRALRQIEISRAIGYEYIVVTPTFYITLTRESEMLAHFDACRSATDQKMIIYNIPGCTGSSIPVSAVEKMCLDCWGVAIKESSGDADYFRKLLRISSETGVALLQGNETDIAWSVLAGAEGIVPVCANYDPALFVNAFYSLSGGAESDRAGEIQSQLNALREALLVGNHNWIAGITWSLHELGIGSGVPPMPLQVVDDERKAIIGGLKLAGVKA